MTGDPALGAALLDKEKPGWAEKIDLSELRMESSFSCVLGQLYGYWTTGCRELGLGYDAALAYSFDEQSSPEYAEWNAAWVEEIEKRLS